MLEAGRIQILDPGADRPLAELPTLQCVHCGRHFHLRPGSGRVRGYCARCNGPICGPGCAECVPAEQQIENLEAGRPLHFRPVRVAVQRFPLHTRG